MTYRGDSGWPCCCSPTARAWTKVLPWDYTQCPARDNKQCVDNVGGGSLATESALRETYQKSEHRARCKFTIVKSIRATRGSSRWFRFLAEKSRVSAGRDYIDYARERPICMYMVRCSRTLMDGSLIDHRLPLVREPISSDYALLHTMEVPIRSIFQLRLRYKYIHAIEYQCSIYCIITQLSAFEAQVLHVRTCGWNFGEKVFKRTHVHIKLCSRIFSWWSSPGYNPLVSVEHWNTKQEDSRHTLHGIVADRWTNNCTCTYNATIVMNTSKFSRRLSQCCTYTSDRTAREILIQSKWDEVTYF